MDYFFGFTVLLMVITTGLTGMFVQAVNKAFVIYSFPGPLYDLHFNLDIRYFFGSIIIELVFYALLGLLFNLIYTNNDKKDNLNKIDYVMIMQFSISINLLYLFFIYVQMEIGNQYKMPWAWFNDSKTIFSFLYLIFILLTIFYLLPKIMAKMDVKSNHINKGIVFSLVISVVIVVFDILCILGIYSIITGFLG